MKKLKLAKAKAAAKKKKSSKKVSKKAAPKKKTSKKVTVESLLTRKDLQTIQENSLKNISVKMNGEVFAVARTVLVPANAEIQRNSQGQVLGTKAIVGG